MPHTTHLSSRPDFKELSENVQLVLQLWREQKLHKAIVLDVVKGACWWVSDDAGKYDDCRNWSLEAERIRGSSVTWQSKHRLVHEHIIPKKFIASQLLSLPNPTVEQVAELLRLSTVCIVSPDEDLLFGKHKLRQTMPKNWSLGDDIWARYKVVDIKWRTRNG